MVQDRIKICLFRKAAISRFSFLTKEKEETQFLEFSLPSLLFFLAFSQILKSHMSL